MSANPANVPPTSAHGGEVTHDPHQHPGAGTYVAIGLILTIITAMEVAIFYIPALHGVMVPLLLLLSATKFILVVMFYMHLKFDSRTFASVFVSPLVLAISLVVGLFILMRILPLHELVSGSVR